MSEIDPETLEKLKKCGQGTLTTQLFRRGYRQQFLVCLAPLNKKAGRFAGEAFTLRFIPSREDKDWDLGDLKKRGEDNLQWEAVEAIEAGQVLVIDSRNDPRAASAGNMLMTRMMRKGVAAAITDGAFRDGTEISEMPFPAYCRANTASTRPAYHRAVGLNEPIGSAETGLPEARLQAERGRTTGRDWLANHALGEEVFGPLGLIVRVADAAEMEAVARSLQGQQTCTLHLDAADTALGARLMPVLERKAGRVRANGFPTGVEVADAMAMAGLTPPPPTSARPRSGRCRSGGSCARSATRTCRTASCQLISGNDPDARRHVGRRKAARRAAGRGCHPRHPQRRTFSRTGGGGREPAR